MQQLLLKLTLIILLGNPILLSAQDAKGVKLDSNGLATLENLISSWETKTDILEKANIAKEIQNLLGLEADGLIGRKTITAIQKTGVSASLTQPSRAENNVTRLSLQVSEGKITQERANEIIAGTNSIREIRNQVKSGALNTDDAKKQIQAITNELSIKTKVSSKKNKKEQNKAAPNNTPASKPSNSSRASKSNIHTTQGGCIGCGPGQNADGSMAQDLNRPGTQNRMGGKGPRAKGGGGQKGGGKKKN